MILDTIVARKREEVATLRKAGLRPLEREIEPPRGFRRALVDFAGVAIIAEAKKASPSKGVIQPDFDPVAIARRYKSGGAQAMSVLTDVDFFQGSIDYIPLVRDAVDLPALRKEFIIDPLQIREAALYGSDAILLIAAILDMHQMRDFRQMAEELGMDVLVEVHNEAELAPALEAGSRLIGVNNRNLNDFTVDLNTTFRLQRLMPADIPVVSESGISTREDMARLREAGVTAVLIGESLMRSADQGQLLQEFMSA
ncbi:MAG: indole-3-glycerol phosphate synthase TrpC [Desulfobulbaceae bacterium]|nr:indole-3-glycerol phosphate synthase TrpC [Desulfobulbaceae bacterium]